MLKKITMLVLALLITLTAFSVVIMADEDEEPESNRDAYANTADGGEVNSIDDLIKAFGEENLIINGGNNTITLKNDVKLKSAVIIKNGSYTINGGGCTVYRGFDGGYVIVLSSSEISEKTSLALKNITLDGKSDCGEYTASLGLVGMFGNTQLKVEGNSKKYTFQYSDANASYGGAILAEAQVLSDESTTNLVPNIELSSCKFRHCRSTDGGGAIATVAGGNYECNVKLSNCIFEKNSAMENDAQYSDGGAIYAAAGNFTVDSCTFSYNSADNGGAIYAKYKIDIKNSVFEYNTARKDGGAIYTCGEANIAGDSIDKMTVMYCTAENGGAIAGRGTLKTNNTYINENKASFNGGGVFFEGTYSINNSTIRFCEAGKLGGGIYLKTSLSQLNMSDGEIAGCKAEYCASLYNKGGFDFGGGAIGNGESEFPQIFVCGEVRLGATSTVKEDVFALAVGEKNGKMVYPSFVLSEVPRFTSSFKIAYATEKLDDSGSVKGFSNSTSGNAVFFNGSEEAVKIANELFEIEGRGIISYKLNESGEVTVRFLYIPVWLFVIICVLILGGILFIFRKRLMLAVSSIKNKSKKKRKH